MEKHFDTEMQRLKEQLLEMGSLVEQAIEEATRALIERNTERLKRVFEVERRINQFHIQVDENCLNLLATQAPMASDLRFVVAIMKINTDLERMGDQSVNIAGNAEHYLKEPPLKPLIDLPRMAENVKQMTHEALVAFVKKDAALARKVLKEDDEVDALKTQIFRELITYMISDPRTIERALTLILIARNLERLGDHATNIAEDVIFAVTGKDIRHGARDQ